MREYFKDSIISNLVYSVSLPNLRLFVMYENVAPSKILYAMHHSVVALCIDNRNYEFEPEEV